MFAKSEKRIKTLFSFLHFKNAKNMKIQEFVDELSKLRPNSTFIMVENYINAEGEISDFNIIFHISYENALNRSLNIVKNFIPRTDLQEVAKQSILNSYRTSIVNIKQTPIEEIDDSYSRFFNGAGEYIKGVKLHRETGVLHLYGLLANKRVIVPITYKPVNHRALTIEKNKIQHLCPVSRFRQFRLTPATVKSIHVENISLLPPDPLYTTR